ncbi:TRAP-type mannitol/chloroaromatic compound transport system, small permease component [Gemmobacter megaterium]|uniref:TRAP transporter small permease protein n=1 Tax=Gemmobacter megaterium TaxID=1086013 RepID=A0A1N7Q7E6_9RHOB|nr:TRAP transporter small permease [Gemmobacter megaterium]GGE23672.1 hypothetical protein GCM10011345_32010 [Gemmobacter megaterium]SIT18669.1 TRAP-type mannitol/chloroaromatic compound transport system, small permease component [Gemmobacter megaterium]
MGALNAPGAGGGDAGPRSPWRRGLETIETLFAAIGAVAVAAMSAYVIAGVIMRNLLNMALHDEAVVVGELMIAALVLPLAKVAAEHSFITVDVLTGRFAARHAIWLNALAAIVGLIAAGAMGYAGWRTLSEVVRSGSYYYGMLQLPEWPGKTMFFAGYVLFAVRLLDLLILGTLARLKREGAA